MKHLSARKPRAKLTLAEMIACRALHETQITGQYSKVSCVWWHAHIIWSHIIWSMER